jgi:hypothetical protein
LDVVACEGETSGSKPPPLPGHRRGRQDQKKLYEESPIWLDGRIAPKAPDQLPQVVALLWG